MTINEYQKAAMRTVSGVAGATKENQLINGAMGLCGESGEFMDLLKKHMFHGHEMDREHMAKELGDIAWYLATTADALGYNLETIMQMNVDKLLARYPDGFSVERSLNRRTEDV